MTVPVPVLMVPCRRIIQLNKLDPVDTLKYCDIALAEWHANKYEFLLACGGLQKEPWVQTIPGAEIMKDYFVKNGIPADQVITEQVSADSFEAVIMGWLTLREHQVVTPDITIVAHRLHARRLATSFRKIFELSVRVKKVYFPMHPKAQLIEHLKHAYHWLNPPHARYHARQKHVLGHKLRAAGM